MFTNFIKFYYFKNLKFVKKKNKNFNDILRKNLYNFYTIKYRKSYKFILIKIILQTTQLIFWIM